MEQRSVFCAGAFLKKGRCSLKVRSNAALFFVLLLAFGTLSASSLAWGQTAATGQIEGTVTDPSHAAVAQATITVSSEATNVTRTAKSNSDG
jgi:hypothetical protein